MIIELIDNIEVDKYLKNINMHIGSWAGIHHDNTLKTKSLSYRPKRECNDWFVLSTHIASWLPHSSEWTIIQFDNSCSFEDTIHNSYLSSILGISDFSFINLIARGLLIKEIGSNVEYKFLLSKLIFFFILFEMHGYIVNLSCKENGELISFQDGTLDFISISIESKENIQNIINLFQQDKNKYPDWLKNENILSQEKNYSI